MCTCIDQGSGDKLASHVTPSLHSLARSLSLPPFSSDPWNHCCPTDLIHCQTHDTPRAVIPPLRRYEELRFKRVGEAIDLFRQLFEVVAAHWFRMCSVSQADVYGYREWFSCTETTSLIGSSGPLVPWHVPLSLLSEETARHVT